jgi:RNA polymerase sigma-70 factor, ECF subfamily
MEPAGAQAGLTDADLVRCWRDGNSAAFETLVRRWQQPLARFLYHLLGRQDVVPDLCQEVLMRLYQAGPLYREAGRFSSWLYRIALNVARDHARRARRLPVPVQVPELVDSRARPDRPCDEQEAHELLAEAVAELPQPLRLVLVLRHYEELSFEEIARLTGTPASTLKSRFAAALGKLRSRLQELGWGPGESE